MLIKYLKSVCFCIVFLMIWSGPGVSFSIIKSLPGFSSPLPFKLETGYIGVEDIEFFYYFLESERNPEEDPLLLWLTGGPGCSTLSGLFFEIGPLRFNMVEYNGSLPTFYLNPYSWTKVANIIFLDAPVGTGFSYSRTWQGYKTGDMQHAISCYSFLRKWLLSHPKFRKNQLYIAGDSYSGMIVPVVAKAISDGIEDGHIPAMKLKGYLLGNPFTDAKFDDNAKVPFIHRTALISDELYESAKRNCNGEYEEVDVSNVNCAKDLHIISKCTARINEMHILEPFCPSEFDALDNLDNNRKFFLETYEDSLHLTAEPGYPQFGCRNYVCYLCKVWASDINVQKSLNIRKGTIKEWVRCNKSLDYDYDVPSAVSYHLHLNAKGYRALIYSGDHDLAVPYVGTESWIKSMNLPIVDDWRPWFVDGQVGGYSREYENNFIFATVKGAGHTAPEYNPEESFAMFNRWISQKPL